MLYLCFTIGEVRYAVAAREVEAIVPHVQLQACPGGDSGQAGLLRYHNQLIPVFDMCQLLLGEAAAPALSTRIMLFRTPAASETLFGLVLENATRSFEAGDTDFEPVRDGARMRLSDALHYDHDQVVHRLDLKRLDALLFGNDTGHAQTG